VGLALAKQGEKPQKCDLTSC